MLPRVDVIDICSPAAAHEGAILLACQAGKHVICEKPLSGYFGPAEAPEDWRGDLAPKGPMLQAVVERLGALAAAIRRSGVGFCYAENFVYAPSVQKEREIIEKAGGQLLRMIGEESHSGSHNPMYGVWRVSGGGSLMGKGCHPLTAMLYLKRVEGLARGGRACHGVAPASRAIRPRSVTCRCEKLTKLPAFQDAGFLRTGYHDIEDHVWVHVTFEDGTVGDVLAGEVVLGGLLSYVEVYATNHRTRCNLSPAALLDTYNPRGSQYKDVYTVEKTSTKEGWTHLAPDEGYTLGYLSEMQDFFTCLAAGRQPESGLDLGLDTITTIYAAYLSDERKGAEVAVPLL